MKSPSHRRWLQRGCLALVVLLYVLSVPWYREADESLRLWLGMPDWVAVALLCYVAVAVVNAAAWMLTDIPDSIGEAHSLDPLDDSVGGDDSGAVP
ncbi:MAG: hypothetical protein GY910_28695 [bacterium]|nr:hypothetical protein [Deltaproteobacteria bacterium]MCP4908975.1 hypothetical protein [bacterium]